MASGGKKVVAISATSKEDAAARVSSAGGVVALELSSEVYVATVAETFQTGDDDVGVADWLDSASNYESDAWEVLKGEEINPIVRPVPFTKKGKTAIALLLVNGDGEEQTFTDSEVSGDIVAGLWNGALALQLSYPDDGLLFTFDSHLITISPGSQVPHVGLTSWPSPVPFQDQLYCFYKGNRFGQKKLFFNVFDPSTNTWKGISELPSTTITDGPSAVAFNNKLYVFHSGSASRHEVWYNVFDGTSWAGDARIPDTRITGGPSAVEHNGKLYCFHQGYILNDNEFWYNVYDGNTWVGDKLVTDTKISGSPSAVVFKDHIYCFYQGVEDLKNTLLVNRFDPQTDEWSGHVKVPYSNSITQGPPSAVAFDDEMYVFHQSGDKGELWFNTTLDGSLWKGDTPLTYERSTEGLGTTVFGNELYYFYQGVDTNSESLMYRSFGKGSLGWEALWAGPALQALGYTSYAELAEAVRVKYNADHGYVVCVTKLPLLYTAYANETRLCVQYPTSDIGTTFAKIFDATGVYDNSSYPSSLPRYTFALPSGDNDAVPATSYATGFVFHQGVGGDKGTRLWFSLLDRRTASWTEMQGPVTTLTGGGQAAVFVLPNSKLYILYQVNQNGGELYYNILDGVTWAGEAKVPDIQGASGSPGAVFFRGELHYFYQGRNDNAGQLWHGVLNTDTNAWGGETQLALQEYSRMSLGPSPAVFLNNVHNLYNGSAAVAPDGSKIVYTRLRVNVFNGSGAISDMQVPSTFLTGEPSAVVFNDILYAFHQGNKNDGTVWYNTTAGGEEFWKGDKKLELGLLISDGPSAMALEGNLFCFVQGRGTGLDDTLFYKVLDGGNTWGELQTLATSSGIGEQHYALPIGSLCIIYSSTPPTVERVI